MAKYSMEPRSIPMDLGDVEILTMDDSFEDEHWQFVVNHPSFQSGLHALAEDLAGAVIDPIDDAGLRLDLMDDESIKKVLTDPDSAEYPLLIFSQQWGIPPSAAIMFAAMSIEKIQELRPEAISKFRQEAHGIVVAESDAEFVIRIPRPFTAAKRERLEEWIKDAPQDGPHEVAWARTGKKRHDPAHRLVDAIPWFRRWNDEKVEPAEIWRDLTRPGGEHSPGMLPFDNFYAGIIGVWKRMNLLSTDGIRSERPKHGKG
jgi:hypothetical protein